MSKGNYIQMVVLAGLISVAGASYAKGPGDIFDQVDSNSDGEVTAQELRDGAAARFAAADADNDGFLSSQEMLSARVGGKADRMLKRFDTDGNGQLSKSELEAASDDRMAKRFQRMLKRADSNGDGKLSVDEVSASRDPAKMIERLDADGNGSLSQEEFAKARNARHAKKKN